MLNPELLKILVCPETKQPLNLADARLLERVNLAVAGGYLRNRGGERVKEPIEEALVREDGEVLYPIRENIPVMLLDEAIPLDPLP
jgi:uncharacterized protein